MKAKDVILIVFDEEQHFNDNLELLGKDSFKKIIRINSFEDFEKELLLIEDNEYIFLVIHAFYTNRIRGIQKFFGSGIKEKYPNLSYKYISEGVTATIQKEMIDHGINEVESVCQYYKVKQLIQNDEVKVVRKDEIFKSPEYKGVNNSVISSNSLADESIKVDYVIITALEDDEMEKILPLVQKEGQLDNSKHHIEYGHFIDKPEKKVAYVSQLSTGMVDASILATEMLVRFKPKFLIMPGVLGGKPEDTNIGDIIVSTKVFTIDKGKLTDEEFRKELEVINTDSGYITLFKRERTNIKRFIEDKNSTRSDNISIHFDPIACVRQVIDREGYFVENISSVDRKTIGLEMESYGIARACELVNNGNTIPLIIKSVMDNTAQKADDAKKYAAWTSAMFVKYIILNDLI